jgi:hypothetical protein
LTKLLFLMTLGSFFLYVSILFFKLIDINVGVKRNHDFVCIFALIWGCCSHPMGGHLEVSGFKFIY